MKIFIESPNSSRYPLSDINPGHSIRELKAKIHKKEKIVPEDQTLTFCNKPLLDSKNLSDYDIKEGSTLILGLKLRGGSSIMNEIPVKPSQRPPKTMSRVDKPNVESVIEHISKERLIPKAYIDMKDLEKSYLAAIDKRPENFGKENRSGYRIQPRPNDVLISKENNLFLTGHDDGSLKIFRLDSLSIHRTLDKFHTGPIRSLALSSDGTKFATGGDDKKIKIIELHTLQVLRELKCDGFSKKGPLSLSFANEDRLLVCGIEKSVYVYDIDMGGHPRFSLIQIHGAETSVAVTRDDKYFFTGSESDKLIKMFDLQTGLEVHTYEGIVDSGVYALATSDNSKYLAVGAQGGFIILIDIPNREQITILQTDDNNQISSLKFTHDSKYLIAGNESGVIQTFSVEIKQRIQSDSASHYLRINSIAIANDDSAMISVSNDSSFHFHRLQVEQVYHETKEEAIHQPVHSMIAYQNENKYFVGMTGGQLKLFDSESHRELEDIETGLFHAINSMVLTKDDKHLIIAGGGDNLVKIYDAATKEEVFAFEKIEDGSSILKLCLLDDQKLAVLCASGKICVFDLNSKQELSTFETIQNRNETIFSSCFTHNKNLLIIGTYRNIKVIDLQTQKQSDYIKEIHDNSILALAVTCDDKYIISPGANKSIKIICLKTKEIQHTFKDTHKGANITAFSLFHKDKYLASASTDHSIKILDLESKQAVFKFEDIFERKISYITVMKNRLIATSDGAAFKAFNLPFIKQDQDFYHGSKISPFVTFGEYEKVLLNLKDQNARNEILMNSQDLYFTPHNWNILHFLSILNYQVISSIPSYAEMKVPFLVDKYGKTPLHYLIAHGSIDYLSVNSMFRYILDYLEDKGLEYSPEYKAVTDSLSEIAPFLLTETSPNLIERYLKLCFIASPTVLNSELPRFGDSELRYSFATETVVEPETYDKIYKQGQEMISFQTLMLRLDYNVTSDDMLDMALTLNSIKSEEFFRSPAISNLIQHLWHKTLVVHYLNALFFTILMLIISVYIGKGERSVPLEVIIIAFSSVYLLSEMIQFKFFKKDYFYRFWNWADIIFHVFVIAVIITRFSDMNDELLTKWLFTIVILCGYTRWASHLRLFAPTRNLIQLILVVLKDMWAFGLIVLMIILGFAMVFLVFEREGTYLDYFYGSYTLLYGNYDDSTYDPSQKVLLSIVLVLLPTVLLNLLVSIMGDSYEKVQEKRATIDSLTKMEIVLEAIVLMRMLSRNEPEQKGYLIFCGGSQEEEEGADQQSAEWEGRINLIKKLLKSNDAKVERVDQRLNKFEGRISGLEEELRMVKSKIDDNHYEVMRTLRNLKPNE